MNADRTRRRHFLFAGTLTLFLVAALLLPPLININRYQRQIASSLSVSLGRSVELSGARLHLLPRPALEIGNFTVEAAPGFGSEPILQCSSVTAALRMSSLWRGQLEIARISLDEPSLNLVRSAAGAWNFESLLGQASRTPQAPTAGQHTGGQHRFPYIEASNARINFKQEDEKLPFSFLNADVSIWLERPDQWQLRFAAQPARTDIDLSLADTGIVRMSGSIERAASAASLPVDLRMEWRKAPLGQVTRMLLTQDLGWRGDTSMTAHITGSPSALSVDLKATANDFHRESFQPLQPMTLEVRCTGTYRNIEGSADGIRCLAPVGKGSLILSGSWQKLHTAQPAPELQLIASRVPAAAALALLRHAGGRLSGDLALSGLIDGALVYGTRMALPPARSVSRSVTHHATVVGPNVLRTSSGTLKASELILRQGKLTQPLPDLSFTVQSSEAFAMPSLFLAPTRLDLGSPQPLVVDARLSAEGFLLHASGSGHMKQLLPLANAFQVLPLATHALAEDGTADYNLTFEGSWTPAVASSATPSATVTASGTNPEQPPAATSIAGTLALHGTSFQPDYLLEPLHIATATAVIAPAELRWSAVAATLGKQRFSGSLRMPLPCRAECVRHFDLSTAEANLGELAETLRGDGLGVMRELLSRVRNRGQDRTQDWPTLEGSVHVGHLTVGRADLTGVAAELTLAGGKLELQALDGRTLGGAVHLIGGASLESSPNYQLQLQLTQISAPELSQLLEEEWGPGTLDIAGDLKLSGTTAADLSSSAAGKLHWQWTGGALPELTTSALSHFDRWSGDGKVAKGSLTLVESRVLSDGMELPVTGTIGRDRSLDLMIGSPDEVPIATATGPVTGRSAISGTLAAPIAETR